MSLDNLMKEAPSKDSPNDFGSHSLILSDQMPRQFHGPLGFASKIEPISINENSIHQPTVIAEHLPPPSKPLGTPPSIVLEQASDEIVEQFRTTGKIQQQKNLFKIVMAKSYFNNFVENLLSKSYVKHAHHFTMFQNQLMDDLNNVGKNQQSLNLYKYCRGIRIGVMDQSSVFVIFWQLIHIITNLVIFFWTPFNIAFGVNPNDIVFRDVTVRNLEYYFLACIIFDCLMQINTSYIDKGVIIKQRRCIVSNYIKQQAIYDAIGCVSLSIALNTSHSESNRLDWSLLPYFIFYMMKFVKLSSLVQKLEEFFNFTGWVSDMLELLKLLYMIVYVGHLFACLWHAVAYYDNSNENWLVELKILDQDRITRYNYSFYWSVQTMITVGYGDISPQNNLERLCANITMFLACGVFSFTFNAVGIMLNNLNSKQVLYRKSTTILNSYLIKNQIKSDLQSRIRSYYDYIFEEEQEINQEEVQPITDKLSKSLQDELNFEIRNLAMKKCKALSRFTERSLKQLSKKIEEVRFSPEDVIIQRDKLDDRSLYIITKGEIQLYFASDNLNQGGCKILQTLTKGQSFGEYAFFTSMPRTVSAKSVGFSRAYKIQRDKFVNEILSLEEFHEDRQRFCEIRDELLFNQNYNSAKIPCYSCKKPNHMIQDCPVLHFSADRERVLKKLLFPFEQERTLYTRPPHIAGSRFYYSARGDMAALKIQIEEFQQQLLEEQQKNDQVTIIEDPQEDYYEATDPDDYSSLEKSRSASQIKSMSEKNNTLLQPIEEEDQDQPKRKSQVKQTVNTAGFGNQDSFGVRFGANPDHALVPVDTKTIEQRSDDHQFSLKYTPQSQEHIRLPNRPQSIIRAQNRQSSNKILQSQLSQERENTLQVQYNLPVRNRSQSKLQEIPPQMGSLQSYDVKKDLAKSRGPREKTSRTRSMRTKSYKDPVSQMNNVGGELLFPLENGNYSMEIEEFEVRQDFDHYFPYNNSKTVIARVNRMLKVWLGKKKVIGDFSLYTFSAFAMNKALRMRRKIRYIDEPQFDASINRQTLKQTIKSTKRRGSNRNSTQEMSSFIGLGRQKQKNQFGTMLGVSFNRLGRQE